MDGPSGGSMFGSSCFINSSQVTIEESNIEITFEQADAPKPTCSPSLPVTMGAGERLTLTFSTPKTSKYNAWSKQITVITKGLQALEIQQLYVHGINAAGGMVTIPHDKERVEQRDIRLSLIANFTSFSDFTMSPETLELATEGDEGTITLSVEAGSGHVAWSKEIRVRRGKDLNKPGIEITMDDVIGALHGKLNWEGKTVCEDLDLPKNLDGTISGVGITWRSKTPEYCTVVGETAEIIPDLQNLTVKLEAAITYGSENRTVEFSTTIGRPWFHYDGNRDSAVMIHPDFPDPVFLEYYYFNHDMTRFSVKEIDTARKRIKMEFIAGLKENQDEELYYPETNPSYLDTKKEVENYRGLIAKTYDFFMNANTLSTDEFTTQLKKLECFGSGDDEDIFQYLWNPIPFYTSKDELTFDEFKNLSDAERAQRVKARLQFLKRQVCKIAGINPAISASSLEDIFLEIANEVVEAQYLKRLVGVQTFKYKIKRYQGGDLNYQIKIETAYDQNKSWNEQLGDYEGDDHCRAGYCVKKDGKSYAVIGFEQPDGDVFLPVEIKADGSFVYEVLNSQNSTSEKITGRVTDHGDGNITIRIDSVGNTGLDHILGPYQLKWRSTSLSSF